MPAEVYVDPERSVIFTPYVIYTICSRSKFAQEDFILVCKMFMFIMTRRKLMYNTLDRGTFHRQGRILLNDTFSICKIVELIKLKVFSNMCH